MSLAAAALVLLQLLAVAAVTPAAEPCDGEACDGEESSLLAKRAPGALRQDPNGNLSSKGFPFRFPHPEDHAGEPLSEEHANKSRWWLGKTFDLNIDDLWGYEHTHREEIFENNIPSHCYLEMPCQLGEDRRLKVFSSQEEWIRDTSASLGLGFSITTANFGVTLGAAMGSSTSQSRKEELKISTTELELTRRCFGMSRMCTNDLHHIRPKVLEVIGRLPHYKGVALNRSAMVEWQKEFIQRFGTHIAVFSRHGAKIKAMTTMRHNCAQNDFSIESSFCLYAFAYMASLDFCTEDNRSDMSGDCEESTTTSCVAIGGLTTEKSPCAPQGQISDSEIQQFLHSGDPTSPTSAIAYKFAPIYEVIRFAHPDLYSQAEALQKATEFHACNAQWVDGRCQCGLICKNGGRLDEDSCSCICPGDPFHGFSGLDCSETYGTCQAGPGTPNRPAAAMCAERNVCQSATHSYGCKPTDVCCLTCFQGKCCPYGSSCQCNVNNCRCMYSNGSFSEWGVAQHASNPKVPCSP